MRRNQNKKMPKKNGSKIAKENLAAKFYRVHRNIEIVEYATGILKAGDTVSSAQRWTGRLGPK